jgi:hypothetical protein
MGAWGEGLLENDTAGDLEVFWTDFIAAGRRKDPKFWTSVKISELFRFCYFRGYDGVRPEKADDAEELLAVGALFRREKLRLPAQLKTLVESAANNELRRNRLQEWAEPKKRKAVLEQFLRAIGGRRAKPSRVKKRPIGPEVAEIQAFMKRLPHWVGVVKGEVRGQVDAYEVAEPKFIGELKRFCFEGTKSDDHAETRQAVIARLMCLSYVTGWMLQLPGTEIERLVAASKHAGRPELSDMWTAEMWSS